METFCVFKVSGLKNLKFYDKWQNCGRFEAKSVKNAQFKAKIKEKTDFVNLLKKLDSGNSSKYQEILN